MQVKTYSAKDTKSALDLVKTELGPDAVILSTKNRNRDGRRWCEITAALDADAGPDAPGASPVDGPPPGWGEWHREWDAIQAQMMALMRPQLDLSALAPRQRQALRHLEREGVGEGALMALLTALGRDRDTSILGPLGEMVGAAPFGPARWTERVHAVTGPSGSGKTTALLRLAIRHHQARRSARILVVDATGGKGSPTLRRYAELSGMTYAAVESARQMTETLDRGQKFDRIFIDLPPTSAAMDLDSLMKFMGLSLRKDTAVHLALSPLWSPAQLRQFVRRHKSPLTRSIIWTKLDEACNFGDIVNAAYATGLPASALSFGSGIRGTLVPAESVMLWKLLFKKELPHSPVEETRGRYDH
ncbi:flagellar biosynthesis protein FlhF [Desulfocurvus sp. DL9XJH121]